MPKYLVPLALASLAACASATVPAPPPAQAPPAAQQPALPRDIHWVRTSAEYRALALQAYRVAGERIRELARGTQAGSWAVILDADETVVDNSAYQKERFEAGTGYTAESWDTWVRERRAGAVPGAVEFIRQVKEMGGRVAIVTNRDEPYCPDTRENLIKIGVVPDAVLCRVGGQSDKNPRFQAVQAGTAVQGLPPLRVLMWVGDNIQDFPNLIQAARDQPGALEPFGRTYIVLPNPMYGSWERNPPR
ncbi:MAG TPA: HAD family acid phosphatase [Longimicrobiaceae bacterium]|nr:HAD family acid phosphatase [Longimicrobiaceae bacterium]